MSRTPLRVLPRVLAAVLATLLGSLALVVGGGSAAASADSVTVTDPSHDVWWYGDESDGTPWTQLPDRAVDDVSSVKITLRPQGLVMRTTMAEVPPANDTPGSGPQHTITRSRGAHLQVFASVSGEQYVNVYNDGRLLSQCTGHDARVVADRDAGVVVVTLTKQCIGAQRWVRVASVEGTASPRHPYVDPAGNTGHDEGTLSRKVRVG